MLIRKTSYKAKVPNGFKPKHINAIPYKRVKYTRDDFRREYDNLSY